MISLLKEGIAFKNENQLKCQFYKKQGQNRPLN